MPVPETLPEFDLYAELGVAPTADRATIEAAFRRLMKKHHPDVARADAAGRRGKRLNAARYWLIDAERRARYDRARRSSGHDGGAPGPAAGRAAASTSAKRSARSTASAPVASGPPFGAIFLVGFMLVTGSLLAASSLTSAAVMTVVSLPIGLLMLLVGGLGMALSVMRPPR